MIGQNHKLIQLNWRASKSLPKELLLYVSILKSIISICFAVYIHRYYQFFSNRIIGNVEHQSISIRNIMSSISRGQYYSSLSAFCTVQNRLCFFVICAHLLTLK